MNNVTKIIYCFLFFILLNIPIYATTITTITIDKNYTNNTSSSQIYTVSGTVTDPSGPLVPLKIYSDKQTDPLDFNGYVSDANTFLAYFYLDINSSESSYVSGRPKIIINSFDEVVVYDAENEAMQDTLIVDTLPPNIGHFENPFDMFYSQSITVSFSPATDDETFIDKYIVYVVPFSKLNSYSTNYSKKFVSDNNTTDEMTLNLSSISDGNYYVLLDANDIAGNYGSSQEVIDTNKPIYIDHTQPIINYFNLSENHLVTNGTTYYTNQTTFDISVSVTDSAPGMSCTSFAIMKINTTQIPYTDCNSLLMAFNFPVSNASNGSDFNVSFVDVNDIVDNNLSTTFKIIVDTNAPPNPNIHTLTRTKDENITITWDMPSGEPHFDYYKVYRSQTDFNSISSNQTLVCTQSTVTSCIDASEKLPNTTYWYGVIAYDKAKNYSDLSKINPTTNKYYSKTTIKTGPKIEISIADGNNYTNSATPKLEITCSSNVDRIWLSCNGVTFDAGYSVDDTEFTINSFNFTTLNYGCHGTVNEEKAIYVKARDKDNVSLESVAFDTIIFDNFPPSIPTNLKAISQSNGSIKLTWNDSDDNSSGLDYYKIYYSTTNNVSKSSSFITSSSESYVFTSEVDSNYFFGISAIDKAGNESPLSSIVSGKTKFLGPKFVLDENQFVKINGVLFLKKGTKSFLITSDLGLLNAKVKLKMNNSAFQEVPITLSDSTHILFKYDFNNSADVNLLIEGTSIYNIKNTQYFFFKIDADAPQFDITQTQTNGVFSFNITSSATDINKVEYKINNLIVCTKQPPIFVCDFNSFSYPDGNYNLDVFVYDNVLNLAQKTISFSIDNINEDKVRVDVIISKIAPSINSLASNIVTLNDWLIEFSPSFLTDYNRLYDTLTKANQEYLQGHYLKAQEYYTQTDIMLKDIFNKLPSYSILQTKSIDYVYDSSKIYGLNNYTKDGNVLRDTGALYTNRQLRISREFIIQEVDSVKYYVMSLKVINDSNSNLKLTIIDRLPKDFAESTDLMLFNLPVEILQTDPVFKYVVTAPANGYVVIRYKNSEEITSFDMMTMFDRIEFDEPIVLVGDVSIDKLNINGVLSDNLITKYLVYEIVFLIILFVLIYFLIMQHKKNVKNKM